MKRVVPFFCLILLFVAYSCNSKAVKGDGQVVSQEIPVDIYNEIHVEGAMDIHYVAKPDEAAYLKVEADDNIIPLLEIQVKKNKLTVKAKESINPSRFVIYTNSPSIKYVESKGASNIYLKGAIAGEQFKLDMRGVGSFDAENLVYEKAEFYLHGSGNMSLGGQIVKAKMEIRGNGNINAFGMAVNELECQLKGTGNMSVHATEKLSIEIKGTGDVIYEGNPQITKQKVKGTGVVKVKP